MSFLEFPLPLHYLHYCWAQELRTSFRMHSRNLTSRKLRKSGKSVVLKWFTALVCWFVAGVARFSFFFFFFSSFVFVPIIWNSFRVYGTSAGPSTVFSYRKFHLVHPVSVRVPTFFAWCCVLFAFHCFVLLSTLTCASTGAQLLGSTRIRRDNQALRGSPTYWYEIGVKYCNRSTAGQSNSIHVCCETDNKAPRGSPTYWYKIGAKYFQRKRKYCW